MDREQTATNKAPQSLETLIENFDRTDWLYIAALWAVAIYGFAIMPFRAVLLIDHPALYTVLTGSNLSMLAHGANHSAGTTSLAAIVGLTVVAVISAMKFLPLYYLLGKRWGPGFIKMTFGEHPPRWYQKLENLNPRYIGWFVVASLIPFSPLPVTIILAYAGIRRANPLPIFALIAALTTGHKILYTYLGYRFGTEVQATLLTIDRYILWITLGLVAWTIIAIWWKNRTGKPGTLGTTK